MKRLLTLFLLVFLTGCVSYYQPESALEDGVYYAEDDPSYNYNPDDFSGVVYYPWASLDYFYFTYGAYPGYGFGYGYPYRYAAWAYPYDYYGYYSPWYISYYHDPYWIPYQRNCRHHGRCGENDHDDRDSGDDRYASDDRQAYGYPGGGGEENAFYSSNGKDKMGRAGYPPTRRYVSKTPATRQANQGAGVQQRKYVKTGKYRTQPAPPLSAKPATVSSSAKGNVMRPPKAPAVSTNSGHDTRSQSSRSYSQQSSGSHSQQSSRSYSQPQSPASHKSSSRKDRD